jgi:MSHA biogenesis protein MshJ
MSAARTAWQQQQARWQAAWGRFAARSLREQLMLVAVLALLVFWALDALWLSPGLAQRKAALAREAAAFQGQQQLQQALQASAQERAAEAAQLEAERQALRQQWAALQQSQPQATQADAARTLALLESLVQRQAQAAPPGALQLVALRALPDVSAPEAAASATGVPRVYRHGVQLVLTGRYEALQAYVQALARAGEMPLRLRALSLDVVEHPTLELTVDLETLSTDPAWLAL